MTMPFPPSNSNLSKSTALFRGFLSRICRPSRFQRYSVHDVEPRGQALSVTEQWRALNDKCLLTVEFENFADKATRDAILRAVRNDGRFGDRFKTTDLPQALEAFAGCEDEYAYATPDRFTNTFVTSGEFGLLQLKNTVDLNRLAALNKELVGEKTLDAETETLLRLKLVTTEDTWHPVVRDNITNMVADMDLSRRSSFRPDPSDAEKAVQVCASVVTGYIIGALIIHPIFFLNMN